MQELLIIYFIFKHILLAQKNLAELNAMADEFAGSRLPILEKLGIN